MQLSEYRKELARELEAESPNIEIVEKKKEMIDFFEERQNLKMLIITGLVLIYGSFLLSDLSHHLLREQIRTSRSIRLQPALRAGWSRMSFTLEKLIVDTKNDQFKKVSIIN